jgi:adenosylcobinamide-phosphate synthase
VLDILIGDPRWLPHPIRIFGFLIDKTDKHFNTGRNKILKGAIASSSLIFLTWLSLHSLDKIIEPFPILHFVIAILFIFYGLANRSLISEALKVEKKLKTENLEAARLQLSYIVGRDTKNLDKNQIRTAVLETLSENLSDGVVAPLFFFAIGGFPLMMAYKMANTLDSMIGYKNEKYIKFGRFAARTDDLLNFIPARITALLMILITLSVRGFVFLFKYGQKHSSPNAGYPEAALAGILDCRFGGPNIYSGRLVEKPFIGNKQRQLSTLDIYKAAAINLGVTVVSVVIILLFG